MSGCSTSGTRSVVLAELPVTTPALRAGAPLPGEREELVRRARLLAWTGNAWHVIEFAIAIAAGLAASSIALVGFGLDSLIEAGAGTVILWRFADRRSSSERAERRAQQLIAASYFLLAVYIGVESLRTLLGGAHPKASWVGIGLAAFTAPTMPLLARAKQRVGRRLSSAATVSEGVCVPETRFDPESVTSATVCRSPQGRCARLRVRRAS
jgi:divalent metal cation (Fe/Co/Zn/Cd) transporter